MTYNCVQAGVQGKSSVEGVQQSICYEEVAISSRRQVEDVGQSRAPGFLTLFGAAQLSEPCKWDENNGCRCALEESLRDLMMDSDLQNDTFTITNVSMWINFLVLCCYIRKTKLVPPFAMNLLWIVNSEGKSDQWSPQVNLVHYNLKLLADPQN